MVRNTGDLPISLVNASLWINTHPITTQAGVVEAAGEQPGDRLGVRFSSETDDVNQVAKSLEPGAAASFSVALPVERLDLTGHGVYMLGVDIRGTPSGQGRDTLGRVRTLVCYPPPEGTGTVQVATALPVTAAPTALTANRLADGSLADAVQPGGRLAVTAQLAAQSRAALAVNPATMAELAILAKPHQEGGRQVAANPDAARVLTVLSREAGDGSNTILLPYGDPDIESLEHHRLVQPLSELTAVTAASAKAGGTAGQLTAWPANGLADAATLEELVLHGVDRVLLSTDALPDLPSSAPTRRPILPLTTSEGPITALVYEPSLLAAGQLGQDSDLMTRQRFLAETLVRAMQLEPGQTYRTIAVLPRDGRTTSGLAATLTTPASARWVTAQPLSTVTARAGSAYTGRLSYPASQRAQEFGPERSRRPAAVAGCLRCTADRDVRHSRRLCQRQRGSAGRRHAGRPVGRLLRRVVGGLAARRAARPPVRRPAHRGNPPAAAWHRVDGPAVRHVVRFLRRVPDHRVE